MGCREARAALRSPERRRGSNLSNTDPVLSWQQPGWQEIDVFGRCLASGQGKI